MAAAAASSSSSSSVQKFTGEFFKFASDTAKHGEHLRLVREQIGMYVQLDSSVIHDIEETGPKPMISILLVNGGREWWESDDLPSGITLVVYCTGDGGSIPSTPLTTEKKTDDEWMWWRYFYLSKDGEFSVVPRKAESASPKPEVIQLSDYFRANILKMVEMWSASEELKRNVSDIEKFITLQTNSNSLIDMKAFPFNTDAETSINKVFIYTPDGKTGKSSGDWTTEKGPMGSLPKSADLILHHMKIADIVDMKEGRDRDSLRVGAEHFYVVELSTNDDSSQISVQVEDLRGRLGLMFSLFTPKEIEADNFWNHVVVTAVNRSNLTRFMDAQGPTIQSFTEFDAAVEQVGELMEKHKLTL